MPATFEVCEARPAKNEARDMVTVLGRAIAAALRLKNTTEDRMAKDSLEDLAEGLRDISERLTILEAAQFGERHQRQENAA